MSLPSAVIDALIASGCTAEQLGAAVKAANAEGEARREARRANNAERQRRYRERHAGDDEVTDSNALRDVTDCDGVTSPALSRPPNEENLTPPPIPTPDMTTRARAGKFPCPENCDPVDWASLLQTRRAAKKPMTESAYRALIGKLAKCATAGFPPGPILATAAERGWQTVFEPDEMKAGQNGRSNGPSFGKPSLRGSRPNPALDMVLEAERDLQIEAERENSWPDWEARAALPSH